MSELHYDEGARTQLYYDDVPPSLNTIGTRSDHWAVGKAKGRWQGIMEVLLLGSRLPRRQDVVHATASLRFPTRRIRDEGNFRWMLEKALGDALVVGGWLEGDDADRFTFGELTFEDEPGPPRTTVLLNTSRPLGR